MVTGRSVGSHCAQRLLPCFLEGLEVGLDDDGGRIADFQRSVERSLCRCGRAASAGQAASNAAACSGRTSQRNRVFDSLNRSSGGVGGVAFRSGTVAEVESRAEAAGEGHLGGGHGQPAFAQVVAGADQPGVDRAVHGGEDVCWASGGIDLGHVARRRAPRPGRSASRPVRSSSRPTR